MAGELSVRVEGGVVAVQGERNKLDRGETGETNRYLVINGSGKRGCSLGGVCLYDLLCLRCNIAYLHENGKL